MSKKKVFIGTLHLGMSYALIEEALRQAYIRTLIVTLVILVLSVLAGFFLGSRLSRPVLKLAKGAEEVGSGNLGYRIEIDDNNEIGQLAGAFNSMTGKLKEAQEAIVARELMTKELEIAREIQLTLIPARMPEIAGYKAAAFYKAAKIVGGDYYDIIPLSNGRFGLAMADVSGKGVPAALVMAMASGLLRAKAPFAAGPKECVVEFNRELVKKAKRGMFLTIFYGMLDPDKNTLEFVSAGHNETFIYRAAARKIDILCPRGFPAGVASLGPARLENQIEEEKTRLEKGDKLIVYTDGITEAGGRDGGFFGTERLLAIIEENGGRDIDELKQSVINGITDFTGGAEQGDDMAIMIIEREK
jgi:sigma-B regulation protein RsbU (phosphoserine phosphatase)